MNSPTRTVSTFRVSVAALAALALLSLATGCGPGSGDPAAGPSPATSRPVEDTAISAEPGERFTLTVPQNPSTREFWYLVDPRPDSAVLVSRGRQTAAAAGDGEQPMPGAAGRLTFTFEAKGKGTTRFTLLHCTFSTCQGNTATLPPDTSRPSAAPSTATATPTRAPERITYTVTVH